MPSRKAASRRSPPSRERQEADKKQARVNCSTTQKIQGAGLVGKAHARPGRGAMRAARLPYRFGLRPRFPSCGAARAIVTVRHVHCSPARFFPGVLQAAQIELFAQPGLPRAAPGALSRIKLAFPREDRCAAASHTPLPGQASRLCLHSPRPIHAALCAMRTSVRRPARSNFIYCKASGHMFFNQ